MFSCFECSIKQTKFIVTLLQTQYAYFKTNGFSGKNTKNHNHGDLKIKAWQSCTSGGRLSYSEKCWNVFKAHINTKLWLHYMMNWVSLIRRYVVILLLFNYT